MTTYSEKMLEAIQDGDLIEAQLQFEEALKKDEPEVLVQLGEQLLAAGFLEEAAQIFEKLFEAFPTEHSLVIPLAEIAIENDQIEKAFELLESIPDSDDSYVESLIVLADLYQVIGVPEVSEKKIKEAQKLLPGEPVLLLALAELYFTMDKYEEAYDLYRELVSMEAALPPEVNLNERQGTVLSMLGEFEEAVPYLEASVEDDDTDQRQFQLAITYIQLAEREKAIALLQKIRVLNPAFEGLYLPLASAMLDEKMLQEAEEVIKDGLRHNPYSVDLYHLASDAAFRIGKLPDAEEYLRKAITLEEDKEFSIIKLANLLLADDRFEDVIDTLSEFTDSNQVHAYWSLAQAHNGLEEYAEANTYFEKALEGLAHEPEFLKDYGLFLREEGQLEKATHLLTHYLEHVPEDIEVQDLLLAD
ncbi:tetratricopeptide repeat protein [Vagococcus intermedius]|uniref:Tetratricopeptide repeat protein n=1 Tax=Vagococcus intermedius TaxID=2991418 RepID=A0AAF0CWQ2_9ENTE|nr:tetratricopeptide repeat protein [Vagococcus intermedius]WEG74268.1 tetratricopeptide repeat protein [Vagococcus intermedius]WEG76350.1 tetratricopeptide repeat protein [Vagococcus intermedius]